jgi:glycosyltransferase involved in cell wall biosynthesis|nr:glycosyltransferase [Bacteroides intestinalis]
MKVIEFMPQLGSGGAERFVVDLCNILAEKSEVILVVLFPLSTHGYFRSELYDSVKVISLNKKKGIDLRCLWKFWGVVKREKPDVVHLHLYAFFYALFSILFSRKVKYIHTIHNDAFKEAEGSFWLFIKKIFFASKKVIPITISKESQKSFFEAYSLNSYLIPNGRFLSIPDKISSEVKKEINFYRKTSNTKIILNVARVESQKNQILLGNCIKSLSEEGYDICLLIIGKKTDKEIVTEIEKLRSDRIKILGERKHIVEYMLLADAFCLSSIHEGMPISLIEALNVGLIPICTPVGGVVDMISDGDNGFLSTSITEKDLCIAFKRFLRMSENECLKMKKKVYASASYFSMEKCVDSYLHIMTL